MIGEWPEVQLDEVAAELTVGYVGPMASEYVTHGIPFLRSLNVEPLRINKDDLKFITPEFHQRIQKSRLTPGDVVIVRTGKPGACSVVPDWLQDANCSDLVVVRCGKSLNSRFLAYYVNTVATGHIAAHLVGAVQQHFNVGSARTLRIKLPPLVEQEAIVAVLGALDDKIELNRQMNATLEAIARALFQSWFVDFDPVRAKLDGRQPPGLDPATAALFPDSFQKGEDGHIPTGWQVCCLSAIVDYLGRGMGPSYTEQGGVCVLNQKCIRNHQVDFTKARRHDTAKKSIAGRILQLHDVLVNSTGMGTLGRTAQIFHLPETTVVDSHVSVVRANSHTDPIFLGSNLTGREDEIEELGEGSTGQTELSRTRLGGLRIILPPVELQRGFGDSVRPVLRRITENEIQSRTLAALRDALLPKLLSGELSVAALETTLEASQ